MKEYITNYTFSEFKQNLIQKNINPARAYQIFNWIYRKFQFDFLEMSDISKDERVFLNENYDGLSLKYVEHIWSVEEEAIKFLLKTEDENFIETVLIISPKSNSLNEERLTLCVSSQVGCPLGCEFCATGQSGFKRNLSTSEIISQVLIVEKFILDSKELHFLKSGNKGSLKHIGNIVFMGMGEPFLNIENVLKSIKILTFSGGYNIGSRHITLSTIGITDKLDFVIDTGLQVRIAISLHSPFHDIREKLMPATKNYDLNSLIKALIAYQKETKRRITFEYILLDEINDREIDAKALKELLNELDYNLNIIPYNPIEGKEYLKPLSEKGLKNFTLLLEKYEIPYVIRKSKGKKIHAGCGQLSGYKKNL